MSGAGLDTLDDAAEPGDTFVLTGDGWERVEYAEPEPGWRLRKDGAYESPDGMTRTWPLDQPTGE
jgi:hypothetical protein